MAYELHITRTRDWLFSYKEPITLDEWEAVADEESRMHREPTGDGLVAYTVTGKSLSFFYDPEDHAITIKGDMEGEDFQLFADLAERLNAHVTGDDSEKYDRSGKGTEFNEGDPDWEKYNHDELEEDGR